MKVHVPKKRLADSLGHVERIIPSRSSNPGLSLLKLALAGDALIFSGSNMDIDIQATITADASGEGTFALPAQVFLQVVRALPGELVEFTFNGTELEIASGNYDTKLQLVDPAGAPSLAFPEAYEGDICGSDLAKALTHVRYAAAVAEYQAIFRGVKLEFADGKTRAVATDGFRLAYYHLESSTGLAGDVVVPARSVDELTKLLGDGDARLELGEGQLSLESTLDSATFKLNVKLMEGTFPDYQRVIPSEFPVSIVVDARTFADAVSRVAVMADKTANNRVDLFIKEGTLQITAEGSYGRSQEALEVSQEGTDPEIALAYNAKYLIDALAPAAGDFRISFSGTNTPSVLTSLDDPSYLAMVVPLRTG